MAMNLIKRLVIWTVVATPVGVAVGSGVSALWGQDADIDRATAGFNGGVAGAWLGLIGAWAAAITTRVASAPLKRAGGSELLTGVVIVAGLLLIGLGLLATA